MDNWIESFRCGDNWAYKQLYKKHWRSMVFYSLKLLGREEDANDVAQFAFIKLFENRKSIEGPDHARNFLYMACRNKASTMKVVSSRMTDIDEYMEDTLADEQGSPDLTWVYTRLIEIISTLPIKYRTAIMDRVDRGAQGKGQLQNSEYIRLSRARKEVIVKFKSIHNA